MPVTPLKATNAMLEGDLHVDPPQSKNLNTTRTINKFGKKSVIWGPSTQHASIHLLGPVKGTTEPIPT